MQKQSRLVLIQRPCGQPSRDRSGKPVYILAVYLFVDWLNFSSTAGHSNGYWRVEKYSVTICLMADYRSGRTSGAASEYFWMPFREAKTSPRTSLEGKKIALLTNENTDADGVVKMGSVERRTSGIFGGFKKLWCVLQLNCITFYNVPPDRAKAEWSKCKPVPPAIFITKDLEVVAESDSAFIIREGQGGEKIKVKFDTPRGMKEWCDAIQSCKAFMTRSLACGMEGTDRSDASHDKAHKEMKESKLSQEEGKAKEAKGIATGGSDSLGLRALLETLLQADGPQNREQVTIFADCDLVKRSARGFGGWCDDMAKYCGKTGTLLEASPINGMLTVRFEDGQEYGFNPSVVQRANPPGPIGSQVTVLSDKSRVKELAKGHGGWSDDMSRTLGRSGQVIKVDGDGDVFVFFSDLLRKFCYNPEALLGYKPYGSTATGSQTVAAPAASESTTSQRLRAALMGLLSSDSSDGSNPENGEKVTISADRELVKRSAEGHGGWVPDMGNYCGKTGMLLGASERHGGLKVKFEDGEDYVFNPAVVQRADPPGPIGSQVTVLADESRVRELAKGHGGFSDGMSRTMGRSGKVLKVDGDGDVLVFFSDLDNKYFYNPEALIGYKPLASTANGSEVVPRPTSSAGAASSAGLRALLGSMLRPEVPEHGEQVTISADRDLVERSAEGFGGWIPDMANYCGKTGTLFEAFENGLLRVKFEDGEDYGFNPAVVQRADPPGPIGSQVTVSADQRRVRELAEGHGGWSDDMSRTIGLNGQVLKVDSDGDVLVFFSDLCKKFFYHPDALTDFKPYGGTAVGSEIVGPPARSTSAGSDGILGALLGAMLGSDTKERGGEQVTISADRELVKRMAEGFGGWVEDMGKYCGKTGTLLRSDERGTLAVRFEGGSQYGFNPAVVQRADPPGPIGSQVTVSSDMRRVRELAEGHGGWRENMDRTLGRSGRVLGIDDDGDVVVYFSDLGAQYCYNPEALSDYKPDGSAAAGPERRSTPRSSSSGESALLLALLARMLGSDTPRNGERVTVSADRDLVKRLAQGCGGWVDDMANYCGQAGILLEASSTSGMLRVRFEDGHKYGFHPSVVQRANSPGPIGSQVTVLSDESRVKELAKGHGGWSDDMSRTLGRSGKVLKVDGDGDVFVFFSDLDKKFCYNPAALLGYKPYESTAAGSEASPQQGSAAEEEWACTRCTTRNKTMNFCGNCGERRVPVEVVS
eukprot:g31502.t1